ncbi:hypothetical protein XANCAGTX0491_008849 [Xanthoria calcicola]
MPPTPDAANRLLRMEVTKARLYYYKHHSPSLEQLQAVSGSEFECVGDVKAKFDRDAISFTQRENGNNAVVRLATGDYTLHSLAVEKSFLSFHWWTSEPIMVAYFLCHGSPKCEMTASRRKDGIPIAPALPLGNFASQMHFIRMEFRCIVSVWNESGPSVRLELDQLFALYTASTLCGPEPEPEFIVPFIIYNRYKLRPASVPGASSWSEAGSSAAAKLVQLSASTRHPTRIPIPRSPSPSSGRALTSTLLPQSSPTSTVIHHPRVLKRKLDELIVHYDAIEEEEKNSIASCRERKGKLWAEWRSTNPPPSTNPQHPAGLKRKLEEMEAKYDRIEDEEKKVTVRCHKKKEKLWENFNQGIPSGHRDDHDSERPQIVAQWSKLRIVGDSGRGAFEGGQLQGCCEHFTVSQ